MLKAVLIIAILTGMATALVSPIDWRNYVAVVLIAVNAFWLGVEIERQ